MSYNARTNWQDHVRDSESYNITDASDGKKNITPAGNVIQQGTPQSATNFNKIEEALQHISNAYDLLLVISQAEARDAKDRIETLEKQVATLTSS